LILLHDISSLTEWILSTIARACSISHHSTIGNTNYASLKFTFVKLFLELR
jgi:hypothetical protein